MDTRKRLSGIDLFRGIAAYAVILVHSGDETWGVPIAQSAIQFRLLFYFAVPFFLATSFYLIVSKPKIDVGYRFWKSRIERILIPYIVWTILYVILNFVVFPFSDRQEQIDKIVLDTSAIIFFGAASYHLYFLPLLLIGSILVFPLKYLKNRQFGITKLFLLSLISILIYQLLLLSNNSFVLGSNVAFANLLNSLELDGIFYIFVRILLVIIAWVVRCLPYAVIAIAIKYLLVKLQLSLKSKVFCCSSLIVFLLVNTVGQEILTGAFEEIALAYSLLLLAISISNYISGNFIISNLGKCAFGIYLIHPLIKSGIEIIIIEVIPVLAERVSIASMLVYSVSTFLISWITVSILMQNKLLAKYMFGT